MLDRARPPWPSGTRGARAGPGRRVRVVQEPRVRVARASTAGTRGTPRTRDRPEFAPAREEVSTGRRQGPDGSRLQRERRACDTPRGLRRARASSLDIAFVRRQAPRRHDDEGEVLRTVHLRRRLGPRIGRDLSRKRVVRHPITLVRARARSPDIGVEKMMADMEAMARSTRVHGTARMIEEDRAARARGATTTGDRRSNGPHLASDLRARTDARGVSRLRSPRARRLFRD